MWAWLEGYWHFIAFKRHILLWCIKLPTHWTCQHTDPQTTFVKAHKQIHVDFWYIMYTAKLHSWIVEYWQSLCQHLSTNADDLSQSTPTTAFLSFIFNPIPTTCRLSHGNYACKNTSPLEKGKKKIMSHVMWNLIINTKGCLTEYFYLLSQLNNESWEIFMPFYALRTRLGRRVCVCCEIEFVSSVSVSREWHALCVFHNHGWENVSNDMEHKVY